MVETVSTTDVPSEEEEIVLPFYCTNGRITALAMTHNIKHLAYSEFLKVFFLSNFVILIEIEGLNIKYLSLRWNYCITILAHYNKETY